MPWFMTPEYFEEAVIALKDFPSKSPPDAQGRRKVVGIIGGEPLSHPRVEQLFAIIEKHLTDPRHRGLWTGLTWQKTKHAEAIRKTFPAGASYINPNDHTTPCYHFPVLVAIEEVIADKRRMWQLIDACPLQRYWSGTISKTGYFMCEVMAGLHQLFGGPGGKPVEPGCWDHDVDYYRDQIEAYCPKCGIAVPMEERHKRRDTDEKDDVSPGNYERLKQYGSKHLDRCVVFDVAGYQEPKKPTNPLCYLR
jgi:hypothetical protein